MKSRFMEIAKKNLKKKNIKISLRIALSSQLLDSNIVLNRFDYFVLN